MARQIGFTADTPNRLVLGAGKLVTNYGGTEVSLGATRGGAVFTINQTYRHAEIDGTVGMVKGLKRIIESEAQLTATLVEFDAAKLLQLIPGSEPDTSTNDGWNTITRSEDIDDDSYITNVALLAEVAGRTNPMVLILKNVLHDGPIAVTTEDDGEATVAVQFTAHYDASSPTDEPWELRVPTT